MDDAQSHASDVETSAALVDHNVHFQAAFRDGV